MKIATFANPRKGKCTFVYDQYAEDSILPADLDSQTVSMVHFADLSTDLSLYPKLFFLYD